MTRPDAIESWTRLTSPRSHLASGSYFKKGIEPDGGKADRQRRTNGVPEARAPDGGVQVSLV